MRSRKPFSAGQPTFVIFIALLLASAIAHTQSQAQKFKVLHTFHGPDGNSPVGVLARDPAGNLYGTTSDGGVGKCGKIRCGTAFKLDKTGKQIWLHSFNGANGNDPFAGLRRDAAGNLYGTTAFGGGTTCNNSLGCGTVFKLNAMGKETVLYKFTGQPDGNIPASLLVRDSEGNLYGTTGSGGANDLGSIFKVAKTGEETVLYSFTGSSDGCNPEAGVIRDAAGNLYGVAFQGGIGFCNSGYGVVYKLDTAGTLTVLHSFGGADGAYPVSVLLFDKAGNLYGTTEEGGNSSCGGTGCGVVFELSPQSDGTWTEAVLYAFCSVSGCTDGEEPGFGPLVRDAAGNIYGTTYFGGDSRNCNGGTCGVAFKLDPTGGETVLHSFTGGADGAGPFAGLIRDAAGNLYGTAQTSGDNACNPPSGCGTVFKIVP
jgi:uncharacterized repeat protein (TIGR03803 family)